jgi:hypothetical protein
MAWLSLRQFLLVPTVKDLTGLELDDLDDLVDDSGGFGG